MLDSISDYCYPECLFTSPKFYQLNADKCDKIHIIKTQDLAIVIGLVDNKAYAPFSAPFTFLTSRKVNLKYSSYEAFFNQVKKDKELYGYTSLKITLPPDFYFSDMHAKIRCCLAASGFNPLYRDINSHFNLSDFEIESLSNTAKKTIRASGKHNHEIFCAKNDDEKKLVYDIIRRNRLSKGYPLRMTWEQVKKTVDNVARANFFYVKTNEKYSASAIIFDITDDISQVVYWGAVDEGEACKVMYFLPFELVKIYKSRG
ncbi:TPA: hypothetical protein ACHK7K_005030, partial [Escherichia coli]